MKRPCLVALAIAATGGCGPPSNTPAGFTAKTHIPLCSEARVEHVNRKDPTRIVGREEIYLVRVTMSDQCWQDLREELERASGQSCQNPDGCHVITRRGFHIGASKVNGGYEVISTG
jgi:hypothetical protein